MRLVRTGTRVEAHHRSDSETSWTFRGFIDVDLGANAQVGLVVNSHDTSTLCTATITNVSP
ncbi:MAG TPA: hypothetical protein VHL59_00275 [Thermoanaerobaculia bacterium]|nr:hypothetical protein [Thermoanaerobaculia bacterium]